MSKIIKSTKFTNADLIAKIILDIYRFIKHPGGDLQRIESVIEATHLQNMEGVRPTLISQKPIPQGTKYIYRLPAGISLKEWLERKTYFELFTNASMEIYPPTGPVLTFHIYRHNFPDEITFSFNPGPNMLAPLPLGMAYDGEMMYTDLSELPHLLVGGLPGFGKTTLLRTFAVCLKSAGCEVFAIDRKRIDFPPLKTWLNVAESEEEAADLVRILLNENTRRQDILLQHEVTKIQDLPKGLLNYLVLIVDEAAAIETKKTYEGIDALARLARATGISIILATQKPSAKLWDGCFANTRDMMAGRISFYVADYMVSQMILGKGNTSAARLPLVKGRAITLLGERERITQTLWLSDQAAKEKLSDLNLPPYFTEIKKIPEPESTPTPTKRGPGRPKGSKKKEAKT